MNEKMMEKPRQFVARRTMVLVLVLCMVLGSAVAVSAAETTPVTADDWKPVLDAITSQISVSTVVGVIAAVVAACVGLAFMWWGVRKAVGALMAAFKKGKVKI